MLYRKLKKRLGTLRMLVEEGILDRHWIRDLEIYQTYKSLHDECTMCKYELLADKFHMDSDTIRKIISKMGK